MAYAETAFSLRPKSVDFPQMWDKLQPSIIDIITLKPITKLKWNHMFSDIYEICVSIPEPMSDRLYEAVKIALESHTTQLYEKLKDTPSSELLQSYHRLWEVYFSGAGFVHSLFRYLNRQYVKCRRANDCDAFSNFATFINTPDIKEIGSLALDIWRMKVMVPLLPVLVKLLLSAIEDDRRGTTVSDQKIVASVIRSFVQVESSFPSDDRVPPAPTYSFYKDSFESHFLEATREYYSQLASQLFQNMSCSQYMKTVIERLDEEERRLTTFCPESTLTPAKKICQDVMIDRHRDRLHSVARELIEQEMKEDLHNMYRLLRPLSTGISLLVQEFEQYVRKKGQEALATLTGENVYTQYVEKILAVHEKYTLMKKEVFNEDGDFSGALDKALQAVVNVRDEPRTVPKASERLSKYIDMMLKRSTKGLSESDIEAALTKAIVIFRYIEDKDVFQKFYSKQLAQRLIYNLSTSMESEELMITKLKNACGYEFTAKLMRMFTDIGISKELGNKFKDYCTKENIELSHQMTPQILQAGAWPLTVSPSTSAPSSSKDDGPFSFALPSFLEPSVKAFQEFYVQSHTGRKLTWLYHFSQGDVRLGYADRAYIVSMTVHQMAIVFIFENRDTATVAEISEQTKLVGDVLSRNLKALIESGLLALEQKADLSANDTVLVLNKGVTSKKLKFKASHVTTTNSQKTVEKEAEHVNTTVAQDRKYYMECAIVRIMKTRKVLKHAILVQEVIDQTKSRFAPDLPFIKKSIEDLIEKLYLQRTDAHDEYQYLA